MYLDILHVFYTYPNTDVCRRSARGESELCRRSAPEQSEIFFRCANALGWCLDGVLRWVGVGEQTDSTVVLARRRQQAWAAARVHSPP